VYHGQLRQQAQLANLKLSFFLSLRLIPMYLTFLNRRHAKMREQLGGSAHIVDESMLRKKDMTDSKQVELEHHEHSHAQRLEDDKGLQDVTDLKNENFIYVV
jgi:hypothetical protein